MLRRAWHATTGLVGIWGSIVTILLGLGHWNVLASPDGKIAIIFLSIFISVLLLAIVVQEYRYSRKARYSEVLRQINEIFLSVQRLMSNPQISSGEIKETSTRIVTTLANIFSLISATKCSVCIKVIEGDLHAREGTRIRPKVVTVCRDDLSREREQSTNIDHWIDQNTDFEQLFKHAGRPPNYFFAACLPRIRGYKNTSFEIYGHPSDIDMPILSMFTGIYRNLNWPLPYKSTIVVPISPRSRSSQTSSILTGYLCVDSRSRYAFSRSYDVDLLTGIADSLYEVVYHYCQLRGQEK